MDEAGEVGPWSWPRRKGEAAEVGLWVKTKGWLDQSRESRRRATGERVLVKMAEGGRR